MNCKRTSKTKGKPCQKVITVKEMLQKKNTTAANEVLNISDTQNESLVEVFKSYGAKTTKKIDSTQTIRSMEKNNDGGSDESIEELFSGFKSKIENKNCEDDSTKFDDSTDELFADFITNKKRPSNDDSTSDAFTDDNKDFAEILRENLSHSCPVCFKKNNFEDTGLYINHLKSCAYKNKISIEQLKKALELQLKQVSERAALGLPVAPKEKPPKKSNPRATTMDSNLELAIALSTSLRESEMMNKIQEKETLIEAGIEPETLTQYKNLEDFGFASSRPVESTSSRGNKRTKYNRNTVLLSRTQQERERIITEKVAMLLLDCDDQTSTPEIKDTPEPLVLKSRYLNKLKDDDATLWKRACQEGENLDDLYYVKNLSKFVSRCDVPAGAKLRHLSQIPCRSPSPRKPSTSESFMPVTLPSPPPKKPSLVINLNEKLNKKARLSTNIDSKFRQDWKYMLNKDILSDLTIYAKNEVPIYAHKLIFYARCRSVLTETIKETENGQTREILMWMEYSYEAIMVLLEYIYTGSLPSLTALADTDKKDLRELSDRYGYKEVMAAIDNSEEAKLFIKDEDDESPNRNRISDCHSRFIALKGEPQYNKKSPEIPRFVIEENNVYDEETQITEGEKNLQILLENMQTQNPRSPEMFSDDNAEYESPNKNDNLSGNNIFEQSTIIEEVLSKLCSPVSSPCKPKEDDFEDEASHSPFTQVSQSIAGVSGIEKNTEKRRCLSPLEKSFLKKSKILDEHSLQGKPSPVISISDTSETSDSDVLTCEIKTKSSDEKNNPPFDQVDSLPSTSKVTQDNYQCPYISPVWEGFEDFNNMNDMGYSPISDPIPIGSPVLESTTKKSSIRKLTTNKVAGDSLFDSFDIDEDFLNKIETNAKVIASQKPVSSTPESVRRFQRRSKSETCITPVNKQVLNDVTPIADYSNMRGEDLKKELEKYGIKPGLSRNKAKMMLRYIYDQLHPFEDQVQPSIQNQISNVPANSTDTDKLSNRRPNADSCDSSDSETSGISVLEETYIDEIAEVYSQDIGNTKIKVTLDTAFRNLLHENESLHQQILLYQPIWLESIKTLLKEYGAKCSMSELMNYLDEKCVTFRSQQNHGKHGTKNRKKPSQRKRALKQRTTNSESSN